MPAPAPRDTALHVRSGLQTAHEICMIPFVPQRNHQTTVRCRLYVHTCARRRPGASLPQPRCPTGKGAPRGALLPRQARRVTQMIYRNGCGKRKKLEEAAGSAGLGLWRKAVAAAGGDESQKRGRGDAAAGGLLGLSGGRTCQVNQGAAGDRQAGGRPGGWRN